MLSSTLRLHHHPRGEVASAVTESKTAFAQPYVFPSCGADSIQTHVTHGLVLLAEPLHRFGLLLMSLCPRHLQQDGQSYLRARAKAMLLPQQL